jgi:hypothetical protein
MDDRWLIPLIVLAFPIFFGAMWIGVVSLLGAMSGWRGMAAAFPAVQDPTAQRFSFGSASIGWRGFPVSYKSILTVDVGDYGIGLSVMRMFGFNHPPMSIPWQAVESCQQGFYAFWTGVMRMFGFNHPPMSIPWQAVESCQQGFYAFWTGVEVRLRDGGGRIVLRGRPGAAVMARWTQSAARPAGAAV